MAPIKAALVGVVALACLASLPLVAAENRTYEVVGHGATSDYYFAFEGVTGKNPTVTLVPGDVVTINFRAAESVHNIRVDAPVSTQTEVVNAEAGVQTIQFTVPDSPAKISYFCVPHRGAGMQGEFAIQGAKADGGDEKKTPGFELALAGLAIVGVALLARRRA